MNARHRLILGLVSLLAATTQVTRAALVIDSAAVTPTAASVGVATPITVTARISEPSVIADGVNLQRLDTAGRVVAVLGLLRDDGSNGDAQAGDAVFTLRTTLFETAPGPVRLRVSAAFRGSILRAMSSPLIVNVTGATATGIAILAPADLAYLNTSPIVVSGTVGDPGAAVAINGVPASVTGNSFQASVPLTEGTNTLTAVAANTGGTTSTASLQVTLDTTPPRLTIESPADGQSTTETSVTVAGTVNDIVVGTVNNQQAVVTVNGVSAAVANRSFLAANVPLALGPNTIQAVGRDRSGNSITTSIQIRRDPPTSPSIKVLSGNNQNGPVSTLVTGPLVVALDNGAGQPVANTPIVFRVTDNNGLVTGGGSTASSLVVNTNAAGQAQVALRLGSRAGAGSNRVEATSAGFVGTAAFTATGVPTGAALITVDSGNNQSGALAEKLAFPFVVVVTDAGFNRLGGVPVTFTVRQGGGAFPNGPTLAMNTDPDGRAAAVLKLGTEPGIDNNVVEVTFPGNTGGPATFIATAKAPGNAAQTTISGVVLDNSNTPIEQVTVRLFRTHQGNANNTPQQVGTPVTTNAQGQFVIPQAPVGFFKLMADGTTVPSERGAFPTLEYDIVTVAGQDNTVGMPLLLPVLDTINKLCVDDATGGTLTLPQVPGFSLTVAPGSATFPGGSRSGCITVSTVNPDKSPMTPGFGQQPRFLITIQPVGTMFNPPAPITMPNVDGLQPGQVTELYSYDHDLAAFTAIGTGTVSEDGLLVRSDPGVGILKAGWHCGGNPAAGGAVAPLSVGIAPAKNVKGAGVEFSVTANGSPPLDGTYTWEIIATQPGDDATIATIVSGPACDNQSSCTAKLKGIKGGKATLRVHFKCKTTGAEVTADSRIVIVKIDSLETLIPHVKNVNACTGVADLPDDTFSSTSDSTSMTTNAPLALPRKLTTLKLTCKTTPTATDPDVAPVLAWKIKRNTSDAESGALPVLTPTADTATLGTDAQGSFNAFCYVDSNGNSEPDTDETKKVLNAALVGITVDTLVATTHAAEIKQKTPLGGFVHVVTGTFNFADTSHAAYYLASNITLVGGGADRKLGVDKITAFFAQDFGGDSFASNYAGGKTVKEVFACDLATPNPIVGGTPTLMSFPVLDDDTAYPAGGLNGPAATCCHQEALIGGDTTKRKLEWLDSPQFVSPGSHPVDGTKLLQSTSGNNAFIVYLLAFSSQATNNYSAFASASWTVTIAGAVTQDASSNFVWTAGASTGITESSTTTGFPNNAGDAGIMLYGPSSIGGPSLRNDAR